MKLHNRPVHEQCQIDVTKLSANRETMCYVTSAQGGYLQTHSLRRPSDHIQAAALAFAVGSNML